MKPLIVIFIFSFLCCICNGQNQYVPEKLGYEIINSFLKVQNSKRIGISPLTFDMDSMAYFGTYKFYGCRTPVKLNHSIQTLTSDYSQIDIQKQISTMRKFWNGSKLNFRVLKFYRLYSSTNPVIGLIQIFNPKTIYYIGWPVKLNEDTFAIQYNTCNRFGRIKTSPKLAIINYTNSQISILREVD